MTPVLAEALALAALGGAAGLALAAVAPRLLRSGGPAFASSAPALDGRAVAVGLAFTALSAALVALLPVAHAHRAGASATLRAGGSSLLTPGRRRSRRALVVAELAIAFVLLAGAGVLVRTVRHLLDVDPGFRPQRALAFRIAPPQVAPAAGQSEEAFVAALLEDRDRAAAFYAVGLYGVLAQLARERAREFGVRLALGARPVQVGGLVLGEGLRLAALGAALGLLGALAGGRALRGLLHGVAPDDPITLTVAAGLMVATAAAAAVPSVLRAARLDPAAVLRDE